MFISFYCISSGTGTRTRVARVRAEYPNQLDYTGDAIESECMTFSPAHILKHVSIPFQQIIHRKKHETTTLT